MSSGAPYALGTVEAAEAVLDDLYVRVRRSMADWAALTNQTPQARIGYIGQHLVSVVTGYPGGRSGARGHDLVLPGGGSAEIKSCTRVDQLGSCRSCRHAVASIELACPACRGVDIDRKDDSKWLISLKSEAELAAVWREEHFFFVLFDFADLRDPREVNARIWRVDPLSTGFAYCMVDYFFTIRAKSASKAPFNLWPFSFKFCLMRGELIFHALIGDDDSITTMTFPGGPGAPVPIRPASMLEYTRSTALTTNALREVAHDLGIAVEGHDRNALLNEIQRLRDAGRVSEDGLQDAFAEAIYVPRMAAYMHHLPS
jgi:hypothetical protein